MTTTNGALKIKALSFGCLLILVVRWLMNLRVFSTVRV